VLATLLLRFYRAVPLSIKRLEATRDGIHLSVSNEGLSGLSSIKQFGQLENVLDKLYEASDEVNCVRNVAFATNSAMILRQSLLSTTFYACYGIVALTYRYSLAPAQVLVAYGIASTIAFYFQQILTVSNESQRGFNAVERLDFYATSLPDEGALRVPGFNVSETWPQRGHIAIQQVSMRYREGLPLVIEDMTLDIPGGSKIGIVGRTGAGKSSIMEMLLRTVPLANGSILIDDVDISKIGVHDLRESIAVITQKPTLFYGAVRSNLDPSSSHSDDTLLRALRQARLIDETNTNRRPLSLSSKVEAQGLNFSVGDRQLLSLARALVRGARIIVADESTASVDKRTDSQIQQAMREGFADCTVLTIAHRIHTILLCDKVCVMDSGRCLEFASPKELFLRENSLFRALCDRSGVSRSSFD
jgi:ATP-binding cassette subfamily C (CFTR/MRP) protein 1